MTEEDEGGVDRHPIYPIFSMIVFRYIADSSHVRVAILMYLSSVIQICGCLVPRARVPSPTGDDRQKSYGLWSAEAYTQSNLYQRGCEPSGGDAVSTSPNL